MLTETLLKRCESDIGGQCGDGELEVVFTALTHRCCTRAAADLCGERRLERTPPHA